MVHADEGQDPNTGEEVDDWGCIVAWLPKLLIENALMSRQTGAAVESFRNEMVKANDANRDLLAKAAEIDKVRISSEPIKVIK